MIIAILMALILAGLSGAFESSLRTKCANNMKQIGVAYQNLATTSKNRSPVKVASWVFQLKTYVDADQTFICPKDNPVVQQVPLKSYWRVTTDQGVTYDLLMDPVLDPDHCKSVTISGVNAPSYGLALDDQLVNSDRDYNDNVDRIDPLPDGTFQVTCVSKNASFKHGLAGPNHEVIIPDLTPGKSGVIPGAMRSSYAINGGANSMLRSSDAEKILLVEYRKPLPIADVVGPSAADSWPDQAAPRHLQRMNVLFCDGHVETHAPYEIDPRMSQLQQTLWMPAGGLTP